MAEDIGVDAVKIGMLGTAGTIEAVVRALDLVEAPVVLDPVMVAESGAALLDDRTRSTRSASALMPNAEAVATPNQPEAEGPWPASGRLDADTNDASVSPARSSPGGGPS